MTFLDHLEELRWHVIRALGSIFVFSVIAFFSKDFIYGTVILGPSRPDFWTYRMFCKAALWLDTPSLCIDKLNFTLMARQMTAQFTMHITQSFVIGLIVAFPYAFWELWRFIKPGLHGNEIKVSRGATFFVSLLFITGILFGYYVVSPMAINFLANYQLHESILNQFDFTSYMSTLIMTTLACGIMFQLPMVVYVLSKIGFVSPGLMRRFRKHSFLGILILSAILTPSPDIFSQLLVAIPLFFLYEISIFISASVARNNARKELEEQKK